MMHTDHVSWGVAILLSLLAHGMIFVQSGARSGLENAPMLQAPLITRLSFKLPAEKAVMEKPVAIKQPPPRVVKKNQPEPVKTKPKKQLLEPVEKVEPVRQAAQAPQTRGQQVSHSSEALLQAQREQYLYELMSHIESFKFYPRAARRRSIEGQVAISFILRDDGSFDQLMLDGDHKVLINATREAMEMTLPLPLPPEDIGLSSQIAFSMVYSLHH